MNSKNYPFKFFINVSIRNDWFKLFWHTRGANFLEIQFLIFKILVGMPWLTKVLRGKIRDYNSLDSAKDTNDCNPGLLIGKYLPSENYNLN